MQECMTIIFEEQKSDLSYKVLPKQICQMKMIVLNKIVIQIHENFKNSMHLHQDSTEKHVQRKKSDVVKTTFLTWMGR